MVDKSTNNCVGQNSFRLKKFLSINDLRDKEFGELDLTPNERLALKNFDRFRITELNKQQSESAFHAKYLQLQVMANLTPYEEFLKEDYFF
ncbi:MAG: hypothetical protein KDD41_13005 [Flavobacteriales bacterium]|nr:hypothetical protein [Flavobacteriales bacterium]